MVFFKFMSCLPTVSNGLMCSTPWEAQECTHFSVALSGHVGTCDSSKSAITSSPVERILIPRRRLDQKIRIFARVFEGGMVWSVEKWGFLQGSLKGG